MKIICGELGTGQAEPIPRDFAGMRVALLTGDGTALVSTTSPGATYLTYASVVDNVSGDPVFISAVATR